MPHIRAAGYRVDALPIDRVSSAIRHNQSFPAVAAKRITAAAVVPEDFP